MIHNKPIPTVPCIKHGLESPGLQMQLGNELAGSYCFLCVMELAKRAGQDTWENFTIYCTAKKLETSYLKNYKEDMKDIPSEEGPGLNLLRP